MKQESIESSPVNHCHEACPGWSVCVCFHYLCQQCAAWLAAVHRQVRGQPSAVSRRTLSWPRGVCVCGYVSAAQPSVCVRQELHSVASKGPFTLTAICSNRTNWSFIFSESLWFPMNTCHDLDKIYANGQWRHETFCSEGCAKMLCADNTDNLTI